MTINLYRPARGRRFLMAAVIVGVVVIGVLAALLIPRLVNREAELPTAVGSDAIGEIVSAQEAYLGEHGRYAATAADLEADTTVGWAFPRDVMVRVESNSDGSAFIAGAVGVTGKHAATFRSHDTNGTGEGSSFDAALRDAGWTPEWAAANGFAPLPVAEHVFGGIGADGAKIITLRMDEKTSRYSVTASPVPTTGAGSTWEEAVTAAGGDPASFTLTAAPSADPQTVTNAAGDRLIVVSATAGVEARLDRVSTTGKDFGIPEDALSAAGVSDTVTDPYGSFRCATTTSPNTIHLVTLCQDVSGNVVAWASTGKVSTNPMPSVALDEVGATAEWTSLHGLTLPTLDALL